MKYEFDIDFDKFDIDDFVKKYTIQEEFDKEKDDAEIIEDYKSFAHYDVDMY